MAEHCDNTAVTDLSLRCSDVLSRGMYHRLFPKHLEISPQLNEVYELALAFYESQLLTDDEIIQNGAYFVRVNKQYTRHFHICTGDSVRLPNHSSSRLKSFFKNNQFRTGYATHGLFPYRGKFHPQMIKALMNIMGLKPGDTVLDPMMGSGTVPIEACLMGIKSVGFDVSPFCRFMADAKFKALTIPRKYVQIALMNPDHIFKHFIEKMGHPVQSSKITDNRQHRAEVIEAPLFQIDCFRPFTEISASDQSDVYNFLLLAYLDSAGYSERSKNIVPIEQFRSILDRYVFVVEKVQRVMERMEFEIAEATILEGDARAVNLNDQSVDGILFSPPYSFAINYLENDAFHLGVMGINTTELQEKMIGLRGRTIRQKFDLYIQDMDKVLSECARVLKPSHFCTIIVGTNDNQLSKALSIPKEEVPGLHQILIDKASKHGFSLVRSLARRISGIANTMRDEYIIIFQRKNNVKDKMDLPGSNSTKISE